MIEMNFKLEHCLICDNTELIKGFNNWMHCPNGCLSYRFFFAFSCFDCEIFDKLFYDIRINSREFRKKEIEFVNTINYWRENDRYLTRILANG